MRANGRRIFGTILAALMAATGFGVAAEKPNVVYLMMDDAGWGDLGSYGQVKFETPHFDKLAAEGMRFTQHYAGSTVCAPTRSVLMTGLHTGHTPVRGNKEVQPVGQHPIPAATLTVAEVMKEAGYATGAFGKWGLGSPGSEGAPEVQGFDRFYGYNCQRNAHTYYPTWLYDNEKKVELDGKTYAHDLIMDEALAWVEEQGKSGEPFFCFLPVTIPHAAMHVPDEYSAPFRKKFPEFETLIGKYAKTEVVNPVAAFAGMMVKLDEDMGRLMALLEKLGIDEDTVVMVTSDNGPHQEGGHKPVFFDSNGPLRGFKRDLYEGGIRAPLIVRWPGKVAAGSESDLISGHQDLMPTLCDLAGVATPERCDGLSYVPTMTGEGEQKKHDYLYWEFYEREGSRAVRFGKWKVVQKGLNKKADPALEVYDLEADLGETKDVAKGNGPVVEKARRIFAEAHEASALGWKWKGKS